MMSDFLFMMGGAVFAMVVSGILNFKKSEWVDLTDDEMLMIYGQNHEGKKYNLGRMVQQALKEKNNAS
jgi:hypothetical protein